MGTELTFGKDLGLLQRPRHLAPGIGGDLSCLTPGRQLAAPLSRELDGEQELT
jgi:hypothetical protein